MHMKGGRDKRAAGAALGKTPEDTARQLILTTACYLVEPILAVGVAVASKRKPSIRAKTEDADDFATGSGAPVHADRSLERATGAQVRLLRRAHDLSVSDLASASS